MNHHPCIHLILVLVGTLSMARPSSAFADDKPSLSQQLRDGAKGKPVLFVKRDDGWLVARTPDKSFERTIIRNLSVLRHDQELELIWLFGNGTLCVLDLRLPEVKPVRIVENLGERGIPIVRSPKHPEPGVYLEWTKNPRVVAVAGTMETFQPYGMYLEDEIDELNESGDKLARDARIVGMDWLKKNADRRARKTGRKRLKFTEKVRGVRLPDCHTKVCGKAAKVGSSGILWVVTGDTYDHDAAWVVCDLFDPKTKRWAYPRLVGPREWGEETMGSAGDYSCSVHFDQGATTYIDAPDRLCTMEGGCTKVEDEWLISWLDPGVTLDPPKSQWPQPW